MGAVAGGEGDGGHVNSGLFGAIIVEPVGARWYRSQLTKEEFDWAKTSTTANGFPVLNYEADYPLGHPGRDADPQHALGQQRDPAHGPDGRHRGLAAERRWDQARLVPGGNVPAEHLHSSRAEPAVPRVHHHLPRRDRRGAGVPAFRGRRASAHRCTAAATPSPSTTAPAASAPRSWPTASRSAPCTTAPSACTRSSSCPPGRWATRP